MLSLRTSKHVFVLNVPAVLAWNPKCALRLTFKKINCKTRKTYSKTCKQIFILKRGIYICISLVFCVSRTGKYMKFNICEVTKKRWNKQLNLLFFFNWTNISGNLFISSIRSLKLYAVNLLSGCGLISSFPGCHRKAIEWISKIGAGVNFLKCHLPNNSRLSHECAQGANKT